MPNSEPEMPRGGHSLVGVDSSKLVVFGGASSNKFYGPEVHVLVFSGENTPTWRRFDSTDGPAPRCRHSAAFDGRSMKIFGGRGQHRTIFDDTWSWNCGSWRQLSGGPRPNARLDASMVAIGGSCVLFGGRNATTTFQDLWVLQQDLWTEPILLGDPPKPRFGNVLVPIDDRAIVVLGGTPVVENDEREAEEVDADKDSCLDALAASVFSSESEKTAGRSSLCDDVIRKKAATLDAMIRVHRAPHFFAVARPLDAKLLDLRNGCWRRHDFNVKKSPAFFIPNAASLGAGRAIVAGAEDGYVQPYIFNGGLWTSPSAKGTLREHEPRMRRLVCLRKHIHARKREVKDAARSVGVAKVEKNLCVVAADSTVVPEEDDYKGLLQIVEPPDATREACVAVLGMRVFVYGGFCMNKSGDATIHVLNLESEAEERDRHKVEFYDGLELARQQREAEDHRYAAHVAALASIALDSLAARRATEMAMMRNEEIRSCLPPLTEAPVVHFRHANREAIWLRWDAVERDATGRRVKRVKYVLSMARSREQPHKGNTFRHHRDKRKKDAEDQWSVVYVGEDPEYVVEGLGARDVFRGKKEQAVARDCWWYKFKLHTLGTEYGWDRATEQVIADWSQPSRPSRAISIRHRNAGENDTQNENEESTVIFEGVGRGQHYT